MGAFGKLLTGRFVVGNWALERRVSMERHGNFAILADSAVLLTLLQDGIMPKRALAAR